MPTTPHTAKQWVNRLKRTARASGVHLSARTRHAAPDQGAYVAWTSHTLGKGGIITTDAQLEDLCRVLQERQP